MIALWMQCINGSLYSQSRVSSTEAGGYIKYLFGRTELSSGSPLIDHVLHGRLNTKWYPSDELTTIMELRFRAYYGSSVERSDAFIESIRNTTVCGSLDVVAWDQKKTVGYGEVDRMNLNWTHGQWQVTLGRQRIAWGTNLVWNPIDIFNPLSILDFDYEERPAVDAAYFQYYTGPVSKLELAMKAGRTSEGTITAGKWTFNEYDYDIHLLAGGAKGRYFGGLAWVGDIAGAGFRGEAIASHIDREADIVTIPETGGGIPVPAIKKWIASSAISADFTFPNSIYLHTEALYNSEGVEEKTILYRPQALSMGLLSPARWSLYEEISADISPLVRASLFVIVNPTDRSFVTVPSIRWSVFQNLDVMAIGLLFSGDDLTEYGGMGKTIYVRAQWSY
jgi:hypothetical protein